MPARQLLIAVLVAGGYYLTGYFGIAAKAPPAGVSPLWPPGAVLLAALLLTPPRLWWSYALVVPTHVYLFRVCLPDMPGATLAVQTVGYMAQAVLAAELIRRFDRLPPRLNDLRSLVRFLLLAGLVAPTVASAVITYLYTWTGWVGDYWLVWRQRTLANVIPTILITPLIVMVVQKGRAGLHQLLGDRTTELALLLLAMVTAAFAMLGWIPAGHDNAPALLYALLPLLLWAAVRFPPAVLCLCLLTLTLGSLVNAFQGRGPFPTLGHEENVLALQLFLISISAPLMLLTALVQERRRVELALRDSERRYSLATAAGSAGVWDWDLTTGEMYLDPALKAILGYEDHELPNTMDAWLGCTHPDDVTLVTTATNALLCGATPLLEVEHRAFHRDGSVRWLLCRGNIVDVVDGRAIRMMGADTDITERKLVERELRRSSDQIRELAGKLITAQEEERRRIARDLHDDLNQKMAALSIEISAVRMDLPHGTTDLSDKLDLLQARTADLVREIRDLSHEIHPATLEHAGLVPALTSMAAQLKRLENIEVHLALPDNPIDTPHHIAICLYRVAQESIRNVVRHAGTKHVAIALRTTNRNVTLLVRDRGRGFDVNRARTNGGLGLISIEERVRLLNGSASVTSQPGRGTTLRVELPLHGPTAGMAAT